MRVKGCRGVLLIGKTRRHKGVQGGLFSKLLIDTQEPFSIKNMFNDKQLSFGKLLEKNGSVSIHDKTIQYLAVETYNISNGLSPPLSSDTFKGTIIQIGKALINDCLRVSSVLKILHSQYL